MNKLEKQSDRLLKPATLFYILFLFFNGIDFFRNEVENSHCIDDIDLVEANEAFAAQSIAVARELGFDMSKVNVNGGAISIGHPVGASGARIIVTLLHEMLKRDDAKKGLATLCIGGGQGVATIFEKC